MKIEAMRSRVTAATLDTLRASRLMSETLGLKDFVMLDSADNYVVFQVTNFQTCVAPVTKAYGSAKNESDSKTMVKRLVWQVPDRRGYVLLHQVANQKPILAFFQD